MHAAAYANSCTHACQNANSCTYACCGIGMHMHADVCICMHMDAYAYKADSTLSRVDLDVWFCEDRKIMKDLGSYGTWEQNEAGNGNYTPIPTQWPSGLTRKLRYGVPKILGIRQKHYTCAFSDPISAFRQKCHDQIEGLAVYFPYPASFECQVWYKADFIMILWPKTNYKFKSTRLKIESMHLYLYDEKSH